MIISQAVHTLVSDQPEGLVNVVINFFFFFSFPLQISHNLPRPKFTLYILNARYSNRLVTRCRLIRLNFVCMCIVQQAFQKSNIIVDAFGITIYQCGCCPFCELMKHWMGFEEQLGPVQSLSLSFCLTDTSFLILFVCFSAESPPSFLSFALLALI